MFPPYVFDKLRYAFALLSVRNKQMKTKKKRARYIRSCTLFSKHCLLQILGQESLHSSVKVEAVFLVVKAVSFVVFHHVFHFNAAFS